MHFKKLLKKKVGISLALLFIACTVSVLNMYKKQGVINLMKKKLPIYCVDTKDKKVAITFDVNWGKDNTKEILDILDKNKAKATFFVIGKWMNDNEDIVKEMHLRGNEIGNHSYKHPNMINISKDRMVQEISATDSKIMKVTGEMPKLFRCPSGSYNDEVIDVVKKTGHYCIQWDVDSIDWKEEGADKEYEKVISKVKPGSILLFHTNAKYTPKNLHRIIKKLKADGYEFVKVSDLIYKDKYHIDGTGKQILD